MSTHAVSPLEATVETRIDLTSRLVRRVDLTLSVLIVCSLILGGLFLAILADHWLLKDGLSMPMRFGIFALLFTAAGLYIYWKIVPLFCYSINPVYTADLIEKDVPTFKNSLINWLLLRQERVERTDNKGNPNDRINDRMFNGIVRTAAGHIQTVPVGHAVDYRKLIWSSTVLAVLFLTFVAYAIFSPKNPFQTIWRVFLPIADIERPQAAQFLKVAPGNTTVLQGEPALTISAEVFSRSSDPVYLMFSTDDGQAFNQRIPMVQPEGKITFETPFPPGRQGIERGFNSSVDYWITQGESQSQQYRIDVLPAATVEIVSLRYDFPEYTGLLAETIEHGGDILALEDTKVTVVIHSTLPLKEITLVFDDTPSSRVRMTVKEEGTEASGTFILKYPYPHKTFAFQATDTNGNASRRSGVYRIEVIPDQPPKVQWADTATHLNDARIDLPLNETLPLPIQAEDPDFALRYLRFKAESPGKRIPDVPLLNSSVSGPTDHRGQISKSVSFSPAEKNLVVGDTAEIWVEALDTKLPEANVSVTRKITIQVVDPVEQKKEDDPKQNQDQQEPKDGEGEPKPNDKQEQKQENPDTNDPSEKQDSNNPEQTNPQTDGSEESNSKEGEGNPDGKKQEQQNQDKDKPEEGKEGQNQAGSSGKEDQQKEELGDSDGGGANNEPSGKEGDEVTEGDVNNGKGSEESAGQPAKEQPVREQEGEPAGEQGQKSEPSPNPETQPGKAMEKIVEQMKEEGKIDDNGNRPQNQRDRGNETQDSTGTGQRQRDDTLDPDSQNRSNQGSNSSDPQQSGNEQGQSGNESGQSGNEPGQSGNEPGQSGNEPGQSGNEPGQSGNESGQSGNESGQSGNESGQSGNESGQSGNESGQSGNEPGQSGNEPGQGGAPEQQSQGNLQNPTEDVNKGGSAQKMGGTGGGEGVSNNTTPDDLNLEYAEKVANLVLEYLEDQLKDKPSNELLQRLSWSEEQLRQFYAKWKDMADKSKIQQQERSADDWKEALKSWGLRPPNPDRAALQRNQTTIKDDQRVTEAQRFPTPPTLLDRNRKYNDGIGKQ